MRQVILDTETTGIGAEAGHRIIEIGCIEVIDRVITDKSYHVYINPERLVDEGAFKVHGISDSFLSDKPKFNEIFSTFLEFVKDAELIIHNASFDTAFINAEFKRLKHSKSIEDYCTVTDTLAMARQKHPGQRNSLDALCKRYDVDNTHRELHGALLDAQILAQVYLAMTGGQTSLFTDENHFLGENKTARLQNNENKSLRSNTPILYATADESASHDSFLQLLIKKSGQDNWSK